MAKKKGFRLSKFLAGAAGLAASALAAKKLVDLYAGKEDGLITREDYEKEIARKKLEYITKPSDYGKTFFDYGKIENDANADILFRKFLAKVDRVSETPDKVFRILDIEKLIPYEESGLDSKSIYNYSIMSMLGGQSGRDYFMFLGNSDLRDRFTQEANDPSRNNAYWKNFKDERFKINDKYILGLDLGK